MNKEQIIDEAYKNYVGTHEEFEWTDDFCKKNLKDYGDQWDIFSKEGFINKIKTDPEFSEKWGLKIEERELSLVEMIKLAKYENEEELIKTRKENIQQISERLSNDNIPNRAVTLTYNNETIEIYEFWNKRM